MGPIEVVVTVALTAFCSFTIGLWTGRRRGLMDGGRDAVAVLLRHVLETPADWWNKDRITTLLREALAQVTRPGGPRG